MKTHGRYEEYGQHRHFIPGFLAELSEITLTTPVLNLFGEAMANIAKVDTLVAKIPRPQSIIRAYVTKEALLSSEIEGTITTFSEVMEAQQQSKNPESRDVQDVLNYINATEQALAMLREEDLPLVERVIKQAHRILLGGTSYESKTPGEYRKVAVFVGQHVPPTAQYIPTLMQDLERFINSDTYPPLIKAGIAHVQFETIHPFLDGNGRIGRLLIVLGLVADGLQSEPILYPSYYFKRFRSEYYANLDGVRRKGDWESWLKFYLRAISETAIDTEIRMNRLVNVVDTYKENLASITRSTKLLDILLASPIFNITQLAKELGYSYVGASALVQKLEKAGIVKQYNQKRRFKRYRLEEYMSILESDTAF